MGKLNHTPEELEEFRRLLPESLHKWIDYLPEPDSDLEPTPNEERNEVPYLRNVPGSHDNFPANYFKGTTSTKKPFQSKMVALGTDSEPSVATLNPKPGLHKKSAPAEEPLQKSLLDLALGGDDA